MRKQMRASNGANSNPNDLLNIAQTADYLGINQFTVRAMIADGRLPAYKLGDRIIRLRKKDIDAALERI
jgi:excisionase family DNA binding protein